MGALVFYESTSELATLTNTFSVAGVPADPSAVTLTVTDPLGASTTYTYSLAEITRTGTGVYTKNIPCTTAGDWQYVWTGTVTAADVVAGTWTVFPTTLGKLYASVDALKSRLSIPLTSTSDDYELHAACFAASRWVEQECGRTFWRTTSAEVRTFEPDGLYCLSLPDFCDLVSVAALKTDADGDGTYETTWTTTDYQLQPVNPAAGPETKPYTSVKAIGSLTFPRVYANTRRDRAQITGVFGWPAVPPAIRQASLIVAADTFKLKDAPFGVAGFGEFGQIRVQTNRAAAMFLAPYKRHSMLVA